MPDTMAGSPQPWPDSRIEGLDACRAVLMMGGLLIHATCWHEGHPLFVMVQVVSHSFRMGVFFGISGFLAGLALANRSPRAWLRRRLVQVGVPALFGMAVIAPTMHVLLMHVPERLGGQHPLLLDWYHLWFLFGLLIYSGLACLGEEADRRLGIWEHVFGRYCERRAALLPLLLTIGALAFLLSSAVTLAVFRFGDTAYRDPLSELAVIAGYAPLYLLGFGLARTCGLRDTMLADWRSPALLVGLTAAIYAGWYGAGQSMVAPETRIWADNIIPAIGAAFCPPAAFALAFRLSMRIKRLPVAVRRLSEASFTIYLVHFPLLAFINGIVLARFVLNPLVEYTLAVVAGGGLSYLFHATVVRSSPLLMLLLNGRIEPLRSSLRPDARPANA